MNERLDQTCHLIVGTRDAAHIPFVVAQYNITTTTLEERLKMGHKLPPGHFVRFIDDNYMHFVLCDRDEAHGIINPFIEEVRFYDAVVIFILPGITSSVRHYFDINPKLKALEQQMLESELEQRKQEDPACAGCYEIRNNDIIRN